MSTSPSAGRARNAARVTAAVTEINVDIRQNPFQDRGQWWWRDENQEAHGPYANQTDALRGLLYHCDKRSRWTVLKELIREFIAA
jgi:hypothetical protein